MTKNANILSLLESVNEDREDGKEMEIYHLCREVLHQAGASFVVLLIEPADFCVNIPTKSAAFHNLIFYRFGEQFLQKLYYQCDGRDVLMKPCFVAFVNEKLTKVPVEGRSIK